MFYAIDNTTGLVKSRMSNNVKMSGCTTVEFNPTDTENEILLRGGTIRNGVVEETERSLRNKSLKYKKLRSVKYPDIKDQLDMLYKDTINSTSTWVDMITEIKNKYPKPE